MPPKKHKGKAKAPKKSNILKVKASSNKIKGRGGFVDDIGKGVGSWIGGKAASLFTKLTGIGDYSVSSNTLVNPNNPPILSNTRSATRTQHREFICDIYSTTAFTVQSFSINPGLAGTFPWLSAVAQCYEQYRLHGLVFEYKSTSAVALNSTNTALGTVIMATEYDSTKPVFADKRSMENYVYSTSSPPSVSAMHPVECARQVNVLDDLYVRSAAPSTSADLRFTDLGIFQIATVGMQLGGVIIGELWCTFDVELIKPRLPTSISSIAPAHYIYDNSNWPGTAGAAPTSSNLFGTAPLQTFTLRGTGVSPIALNGNLISFTAPGNYFLYMYFSGTSATLGTFSFAVQTGSGYGAATAMATWFPSGNGNYVTSGCVQAPVPTTASTLYSVTIGLNVTSASATVPAAILLTTGTLPSSITAATLFVSPYPVPFLSPEPSIEALLARLNVLEKRVCEEKYVIVRD